MQRHHFLSAQVGTERAELYIKSKRLVLVDIALSQYVRWSSVVTAAIQSHLLRGL